MAHRQASSAHLDIERGGRRQTVFATKHHRVAPLYARCGAAFCAAISPRATLTAARLCCAGKTLCLL